MPNSKASTSARVRNSRNPKSLADRKDRKPKTDLATVPKKLTQRKRKCPTCNGRGLIGERKQVTEVLMAEIAKEIGLSASHVSRLFSKDAKQRRGTSFATWHRIARYLRISLDELFEIVCGEN